ncbi:MAG: glycosyltransferase family 4 protein [Candidatus Dormibacteria bacterium]
MADEALLPGLNLAGLFRSENGLGESARLLVAAVEASDIPFTTMTYTRSPSRQGHAFQERGPGRPIHDINIVAVNADHTISFAADAGPGFFRDRYTIGTWAWETDRLPPRLFGAIDFVDEIWMPSEYSRRAAEKVTHKPTFSFPHPVVAPRYPADLGRQQLGMPSGYTFLFCFDFMSTARRKNPLGLVEAFKRAFLEGAGPQLVIKSANGDRRAEDRAELVAAIGSREDITLVDRYVPPGWITAMIAACDCYISLHRSEGFGLTLAEAMLLGKPTIATGYSGNLDFMTSENSYLVRAAEVPVGPGIPIYPAEGMWGEPDLDDAARLMREVAADPEAARAKGAIAREDIRTRHSVAARAELLSDRIATIRARTLPFKRDFGPGFETLGTLQMAALAIGAEPKTDLPVAHGGLYTLAAKLGRRVFGRMMIPYRQHQNDVDRLLHETLAEQAARIRRLEGELSADRLNPDREDLS